MKFMIAFAVVLGVALAVPVSEDKDAQVLKFDNDVGSEGYSFEYDTSNGIKAQESGQLKSFGDDVSAVVVKGSYSFTAADGQVYTVNYVADENGFQPEAAHLPQA
ncbi:larval cuticle protein 65Ag1-like [Malaya genurostris]|uniref:larval cuticle protein 65Ag1-like n=1 Tax=Malaya genurostris TaxID=325434 RepID=UPI0026F3CA62|nr:larval cuticle protein 65Ag1-like [Malaya genurostris]